MSDGGSFVGGAVIGILGTAFVEEGRLKKQRDELDQAIAYWQGRATYWQGRATEAEAAVRERDDQIAARDRKIENLDRRYSADQEAIAFLERRVAELEAEKSRGDTGSPNKE